MIKCQKKVFIVFCLSVILIDSVFRMSKNYPNYRNYPNVFKRMWIIVKKKKLTRHNTENPEIFSDEENSNKENSVEENFIKQIKYHINVFF